MKITKFYYSLLFCSLTLLACHNNEQEMNIQKCLIDDMEFSYCLKDTAGVERNSFSKGELLVIGLSVKNKGNNTVMVNSQYFGACYDEKNQRVEEMGVYIYPDTLPVYKEIRPGSTRDFSYLFVVDAPSGSYHYQNPHVSVYFDGKEESEKEYVLPLTINFKVK